MSDWFFPVLAAGAVVPALPWAWQRTRLSRAKLPGLVGHARMAKRLARWMPALDYGPQQFFGCDGAPAEVIALRQQGFAELAQTLDARFGRTWAASERAAGSLPDARFTGRYRVPFPFAHHVKQNLKIGNVVRASRGVQIEDLDGNWLFDLTGSYGVNVFGHDFYKQTIAEGIHRTGDLSPLPGPYHSCAIDNAERLKAISGLGAVSFHMSGTEAVMQAVRLARFHRRRKYLVRFAGAYHGWWEDVQPGPGNPLPPRETYTLRDMDPRSLEVLRQRRDIACVLVNPIQALHPNTNPPTDGGLIDGVRRARFDRSAYTHWLKALRKVCDETGTVLIFDEVFMGFRLAPGGAQEYFGVQADIVTYGKTLGGGLPVGVVCGRADLMQRFREDRPGDVVLARGTFNAHPLVMGAMAAFLDRLGDPSVQRAYAGLDATWHARADRLNARLRAADVPVHIEAMSTVWTVTFLQPGRHHWLLQFYLRAHGIALSWVGTGRIVFSLNWCDADFDAMCEAFVAACLEMKSNGWWWRDARVDARQIRGSFMKELLAQWWQGRWARPSDPHTEGL